MKVHQLSLLSTLGGTLLLAGTGHAEFTGIEVEEDLLGLNGQPLLGTAGYNQERVFNVYAVFDDPGDQCFGVTGPLDVGTSGAGFTNAPPPLGGDTPPRQDFLDLFPSLNWDSYVAVGARFDGPPNDTPILLPGFVGPNANPWTTGVTGWHVSPASGGVGGDLIADITGDGNVNASDLIEVILQFGNPGGPADINSDNIVDNLDYILVLLSWGDGTPLPQTIAGNWPGNRVLIMRLAVPVDGVLSGSGNLLITTASSGDREEIPITFGSPPFLPGACCVDIDCYIGTYEDCVASGGVFVGVGKLCTDTTCNGACCFDAAKGRKDCVLVSAEDCALIPGGVFLGGGTRCATQQILEVIHETDPPQWDHIIHNVSRCPGFDEGPGGCVGGADHIDTWGTGEGGGMNCENFAPGCPLPMDFFGAGSDAFDGVVCFQGQPLGVVDIPGFGPLDFEESDTLVRRSADPFDRCDLPSPNPQTVDIVIEQLHLVSVQPIIVTFNGGQDPEAWDVEVRIDGSAGQQGGQLTAVKTHCNGGTFDSILNACPQFIFTRVDDQQQVTLDYCDGCNPAGITMNSTGGTWVHDVEPGVNLVSPVCSQFVPGLQEMQPKLDCDCNGNLIRDKCDIEAGAGDCNEDGMPDECTAAGGCLGDIVVDNTVNVQDLLQVILDWGCDCNALPLGPCIGDVNFDGKTNVLDLVGVILAWGDC